MVIFEELLSEKVIKMKVHVRVDISFDFGLVTTAKLQARIFSNLLAKETPSHKPNLGRRI